MKTIRKIWYVLFVPVLFLSSCGDLLQQKVTIAAPEIEFTATNSLAEMAKVKGDAVVAVDTICDKEINLDIAKKIKDALGANTNIIKGMNLKDCSVKVVSPTDFDMNELKDLKLYYNTTDNLVASADVNSIDNVNKTIKFKVKSAGLFSKLNGGETLRVIITNSQKFSKQTVTLKFSSNYEVTVGL